MWREKNYNRETVAIQQKILEEKNWTFCFKSVNYHAKNVVIIFYRNSANVFFFGGGEFSATLTSDFESGLVPLPMIQDKHPGSATLVFNF
jgi:hypothetical protein